MVSDPFFFERNARTICDPKATLGVAQGDACRGTDPNLLTTWSIRDLKCDGLGPTDVVRHDSTLP
jgi:hypothetical protein